MYEFFDHTADLGIHVETEQAREALRRSRRGALRRHLRGPRHDPSARIPPLSDPRRRSRDAALRLAAALLLAFETEGWLLHHADVTVGDEGLTVEAWGEPFDPDRHPLAHEVKAITYHGLFVRREGNGWAAEVIVDI